MFIFSTCLQYIGKINTVIRFKSCCLFNILSLKKTEILLSVFFSFYSFTINREWKVQLCSLKYIFYLTFLILNKQYILN